MTEKVKGFIGQNLKFVIIALTIVILGTCVSVFTTDTKNVKTAYDGLIVTDKAGKAYVLSHKFSDKFVIDEFDIVNMRVKRK